MTILICTHVLWTEYMCVKFLIYRHLILRVTFILRTEDKKYIMDIFYILISSPTQY